MSAWKIEIEGKGEVWVRHYFADGKSRFIARFKYANPKRSANHFVKFLKENYTPEEYFTEMDKRRAPLDILKDKGFVSYNVMQAQFHF